MIKEIVKKLNANLGKEVKLASSSIQEKFLLEKVHICKDNLVINNDVKIDINSYHNVKILDEKLISFHGKLGIFLIAVQ